MKEYQKGGQQAGQRGGAVLRILLILALIASFVTLFSIETKHYREIRRLQERTGTLQEDVRDAKSHADAALAAIIAPDTIAQAQHSVYLIVVNGAARGTAFVIDRERGILATAAHTAASLPLDDPKARVTILNRDAQHDIPVVSAQTHAGFGAFKDLVEEYQPIRRNSSIYAPLPAVLRDLAFDAALIRVEPFDSETGDNRLGPDLSVASEEALLALTPGAPIAVIGYPYDTLDDGFSPDAAIPRAERGVIAAMTPPLDTVLENRDPVIANLIIHRLATAGGNSGSPIINAAGEVIGIHTHGVRSTSSNGDGAAQRAEVIYDLLTADREESRLQTVFFPAWRRMLSHWARAENVLPWSFYMEYARPDESPTPTVGDIISAATLPFDPSIEQIAFEDAAQERRVDAPDLAPSTTVKGAIDDTSGAPTKGADREGASFLIRESGRYAEIWRTIDRRRDHVLFAFDYSIRSTRGFCPLTAYWRKKGDTRLRVARSRASFELHLDPLGADAGDPIEDYQIILRRSERCDPDSNQFFAGSVSWPLAKPTAQTVAYAPNATAAGRRSNDGDQSEARLIHAIGSAVSEFFACRTPRSKRTHECQPPEYLELERAAGKAPGRPSEGPR